MRPDAAHPDLSSAASIDTAAVDRHRAIAVTTVIMVVLAGLTVAFILVSVAFIGVFLLLLFNITQLAGYLIALDLNRRGYHTAARLLGLAFACAGYLWSCVSFGRGSGSEFYAIPLLALPLLIFTRTERKLLVAVYVVLVATVLFAQVAPSFIPPIANVGETELAISHAFSLVTNIAIVGVIVFYTHALTLRAEDAINRERERSDRLLANILPASIAERLKHEARSIADRCDDVTVLFADLADFTTYAADQPPEAVVDLLNRVFYAFDDMVDRRGLEKIKTVGDAYMAAGGVPVPRPDHATAMADLAVEMMQFVESLRGQQSPDIRLRIGMHSGRVIAGVIGKRKFSYDLWGDTVNVASRLQSASEPGRIHLSEETRQRLGPRYVVEARGLIALKGRGSMNTYFLQRDIGASAIAG
ncbi:MAG TPA: adenylate/guanylate cyclase domain-containing protein [Candidatus Cybelea sp.]|nr:adenylate/guanylate cyclase domain-containing protein [Candidatus Cybelea sp.]